MLAEQIEFANINEENPFQLNEITATPQEELLVVDEDEEGDSEINIDWWLAVLYLLFNSFCFKNIFFDLKIIIEVFLAKIKPPPLSNKPPPLE